MPEKPIPLFSEPGIQRDGTRLAAKSYVDAEWCRWQRGLPQKIGGYQQVTDTVPEVTRGMTQFSEDDIQYLHLGHPNTLGQYQVSNGTLSLFTDRTPAGFVTDVNNLWQFAVFADTSGTGNQVLVAHAAPNALNIDNSIGQNVYLESIVGVAPFTTVGFNAAWNAIPLSGGIVTSGQYLFGFGSDGLIRQSQLNDLSTAPVDFNIGTQKIVVGKAVRGAGNGPAVLFWSLDSLIRGTFNSGGPPDFAFDILDDSISILSSQGVIEYDGVFYWPGIDRWYMFNGVVREIPNTQNDNWFFRNINFTHRQKVFAVKVPRFGEIWWCYPRGNATECTHAVIYNVRGNFWYDTPLPAADDGDTVDQGRTAGVNADVYRRPFMVDNEVTSNGRTLWQHETGVDRIRLSAVSAVRSFFETSEFNLLETGETTRSIRIARVEPDFVQVGDMTCTVRGRQNAKAPITEVPAQTIVETPTEGTEETLKFKDVRRLMSFKFKSNVQGGFYEYGETYAHIEPADGRVET